MNQPEDNVREIKREKSSNVLVFLLLMILIIGIAALVYLKSQDFDFKSINLQDVLKNNFRIKLEKPEKAKATVIPCDEKEKYAFTTYKDLLIKCTSDNVKAIDKLGNEQWSIPVAMSNPRIKKSNSDLLVYDLGGRDLVVINGKTVKWSRKFDNNLINADISQSGHVSAVQELKSYKGAVTVFNLQGNEFFTRSYADNFAFQARVSPAGKYVTINSLDISGIQGSSTVEYTDMLGKPFAAKIPKQGEVFPGLHFIKDDILIAISEASIVCYDKSSKEQKEKWKQDFNGRVVYSAKPALGKYLFLAVSGEEEKKLLSGAVTEIKVLNADGKQISQYILHDRVQNISVYSDLAAVNTGREVFLINTHGKLVGKYTSKVDISEVHFFSKQEIAVVSKSNVIITKIEQ